MNSDQRPLTEAEYAAMLPYRMRRIAGVLNVRYAAILPDGIRLEWPADDQEDEQPGGTVKS